MSVNNKLIPVPFAENAGDTWKYSIPNSLTSSDDSNKASYDTGFPPVTMTPIEAGGIPFFGQDVNGILNDTTTAIRFMQTGDYQVYDSDFAKSVGGYPKGAQIKGSNGSIYICTTDGNTSDPKGLKGWQPFFNSAVNSTSTTQAATPSAVKSAYDLANQALPKSGGTITGQVIMDYSSSGIKFNTENSNIYIIRSLGNNLRIMYYDQSISDWRTKLQFLGSENRWEFINVDSVKVNGTDVLTSIPNGTTSTKGIVQLSSATNSTSTTLAATPSAVKSAYDLASDAMPNGTGGIGLATQTATNGINIDTYAFNVGFYSGNKWSSTKGLPFGKTATDVWFYLINQNLASDGGNYKLQILGLNETGTPRLAMRYKVKGSWTDWTEFANKEDIKNYLSLNGGTVTGETNFTGGLKIKGNDAISLSDFSLKEGKNGYCVLPNGLTLQWGNFQANNGTISFPIAFSVNCWSLSISLTDSSTKSDAIITNSINKSGFFAYGKTPEGETIPLYGSFIAIGK